MKEYRSFRDRSILFAKGIVMGGADIIPGVSGGTIALISGIYEHLIAAISQVGFAEIRSAIILPFVLRSREKREAHLDRLLRIQWSFLLFLGAGIVTGILSMSRLIPSMMENYPFYTYSFFFGLILISISIPLKGMKKHSGEFLTLLIFAVLTFAVVGYSRVSSAAIRFDSPPDNEASITTDNNGRWEISLAPEELSTGVTGFITGSDGTDLGSFQIGPDAGTDTPQISSENLKEAGILIRSLERTSEGNYVIRGVLNNEGRGSLPFIFISGALAICAMILPGISGAYILVLLGEYRHVLESLHNHDMAVLATLLAGIAVGIFSFVRILRFMLSHHHSLTMAALTGIMVGSLRKIWPGSYLDGGPIEPFQVIMGVGIAVFGGLLIFGLEQVSKRLADPEPPY